MKQGLRGRSRRGRKHIHDEQIHGPLPRRPGLAVDCSPWWIVKYNYRADPILGGTLAYWQRKRAGRAMPTRRDIDPIEIPKLLPHLQLIEVVGERFRYRLIGTALAQAFGRDYTGAYPEEVSNAERAEAVCRIYRLVQEKRQPVFLRSSYVGAKNVDLMVNRLYLPLSDDGDTVNMILGCLTFEFLQPLADAWGSAERALFGSDVEMVEVSEGPTPSSDS